MNFWLLSLWTSLWFERVILKHKKQHIFYVFWTSKYTVNLSHKNFWTFPRRALELLAPILFIYELFLKVQKMALCFYFLNRSILGFNELRTSLLFQFELHIFIFWVKNCIRFLYEKNRTWKYKMSLSRKNFLKLPRQSTWTSFNKPVKLLIFYTFILIWNAFLAVVELLVVFILNFCHVFLFNLSDTRISELSRVEHLNFSNETLCFAFSFFFNSKCTPCSMWTFASYQSELLSVTWKYLSVLWILIWIS